MDLPTFDKVRERFLERTNAGSGSRILGSESHSHQKEGSEHLSDMHIGEKLCTNENLSDDELISFITSSCSACGEVWSDYWGHTITDAVASCRKLANNAEMFNHGDTSILMSKVLISTCEFINGLCRLNVDIHKFLSEITFAMRHQASPSLKDMHHFNFECQAVRGGCNRNRDALDLYTYLVSKSGFGHTYEIEAAANLKAENSRFPWPLVEMAEFSRVNNEPLRNYRNVVVIVGLPKDYDSSGVLALQKFLAETLLRNVVPRVQVKKLYLPSGQPYRLYAWLCVY